MARSWTVTTSSTTHGSGGIINKRQKHGVKKNSL